MPCAEFKTHDPSVRAVKPHVSNPVATPTGLSVLPRKNKLILLFNIPAFIYRNHGYCIWSHAGSDNNVTCNELHGRI
jgi:hypothetical protein